MRFCGLSHLITLLISIVMSCILVTRLSTNGHYEYCISQCISRFSRTQNSCLKVHLHLYEGSWIWAKLEVGYTSPSLLEDKQMADPFNDRITMEQFHELFDQSDDSDEEFEGFWCTDILISNVYSSTRLVY